MPKQVVGQKGRSRQIDDTPAVNLWKTDIIDGRDPGFEYQFFREDQVRDKLRADRVTVRDPETGAITVRPIPGWEICRRDTSAEELAGFRPDEGKPIDNVLRHGPMVAMKIPRDAWDLLQRAQETKADLYDVRLRAGHREEYDNNGDQQSRFAPGQKPAVSITEHPLQRY